MKISDVHPYYAENFSNWKQIYDCLKGQKVIKDNTYTYLPFPVAFDQDYLQSIEYMQEYELYLRNAQFVEFTKEAVEDLVGAIFARDPIIDDSMPTDLNYIDISALCRDLTKTIVSYGRCFVVVDYPSVEATVTKYDENVNGIKAYYTIYDALEIINWETSRLGGDKILTKVVVKECHIEENEEIYYYREFVIESGVYVIRLYNDSDELLEEIYPRANDAYLTEIPGVFFGSVSNTCDIDPSPIIGISNANIRHYQVTAELAHTLTYMGHPMLAVTNAPTGYLDAVREQGERTSIGPSHALVVEEGGNVQVLQVGSDMPQFKELERLESSMSEMGYRLKSDKAGVEAAKALEIRNSGRTSKLAFIATQTETGVVTVLQFMAQFMNTVLPENFTIDLNKRYIKEESNPQLLNILNSFVDRGKIPIRILYDYMVNTSLIDEGEDYEALQAESEEAEYLTIPPNQEQEEEEDA